MCIRHSYAHHVFLVTLGLSQSYIALFKLLYTMSTIRMHVGQDWNAVAARDTPADSLACSSSIHLNTLPPSYK